MAVPSRTLLILLGALMLLHVGSIQAADLHLGVVVSSTPGMLVVANEDGQQQQTFTITAETPITLNSMPAKLENLTQGDLVTVTTETVDGKTIVAKVDAKSGKIKGARDE